MSRRVLIVHAPDEEGMAEALARPLREAGLDVHHAGSVLAGQSKTETALSHLQQGSAVILCGTVHALGISQPTQLVHAARAKNLDVFLVQMEQSADVQRLALDASVFRYWLNPAQVVEALINLLRPPITKTEHEQEPPKAAERWSDWLVKARHLASQWPPHSSPSGRGLKKELYVPRRAEESQLNDFLASPAIAAILLGESGAGKTELLLSWAQRMLDLQHCVLYYDATLLPTPDIEIHIAADIGLNSPLSARPLPQTAGTPPASEARLLILIDGLNAFSSTQGWGPEDLLKRFDAIVRRVTANFVKLVVSCSVPTWQRLTLLGITHHLAWPRYHQFGDSATLLMGDFTDDEMKLALQKYGTHFSFDVSLDQLAQSVIDHLRHPLALAMSARIGLLNGLLSPVALLPLFHRYYSFYVTDPLDAHFLNVLANEVINGGKIYVKLSTLASLFHIGAEVSPAWSKSSYYRLQEAGLLKEQLSPHGVAMVAFANNLIGAYTLARHLTEVVEEVSFDLVRTLSKRTNCFALAWDALKFALLLAKDESLLAQLAVSTDGELRVLAAETLGAAYFETPDFATSLIARLLAQTSPLGHHTAIRAASLIGRDAQPFLVKHILNSSKDLRDNIRDALYITYLREVRGTRKSEVAIPAFVYSVLTDLVAYIKPPTFDVLEFVIDVTVLIYKNHCERADVIEYTSRIYEKIAKQQLRLNILRTDLLGPNVERMVFRAFFRAFSGRILNTILMRDILLSHDIFSQSIAVRRCLSELAKYLDPNSDVSAATQQLCNCVTSTVPFFRVAASLILAVHAAANWPACARVLQFLREDVGREAHLWLLLSFSILLPDTPDAWIPFLEELTESVFNDGQDFSDEINKMFLSELNIVFLPLGLAYGKARCEMSFFKRLLEESAADNKRALLASTIKALGPVGLYFPADVLSLLSSVVSATINSPERAALVDALGLIRSAHLDDADVFLETSPTVRGLRAEVAAHSDITRVREYVRTIGAFNNSVHLTISYPLMRQVFSVGAFQLLSRLQSREAFLVEYTRGALRLFRDADFDLRRWTVRENVELRSK